MELFLWIILGLTAGWIISLFLGTYTIQGMITDAVLGSIGAIVGGLILNIMAQPYISGFNFYSLLIAAMGAVVLIWLGKMISVTQE
ncbi:GlsB/YeaQ/YmgE family stress response membrane protein [Candidatus Woesebacteria bacterium]|nr:GlsB/YeaQ/YmgE family stress response membrane protein [Candidatus Woesebacteria bacterium]